jgi:peptidoglycan/xylan/chitin deacetylase (PgdA/CDA1 family)
MAESPIRPWPPIMAALVLVLGLAVAFAAAPARATSGGAAPRAATFGWPVGTRAAISLSFDDARESQLVSGLPLFAERNVHVTFYLTASNIGSHASDWRRAAAAGHELGNHSMNHPCTGNFEWARTRALEDYTLARMRGELVDANRAIEQATGVKPVTFAYPCGQTFVGRAAQVTSYVPLVHEMFLAGRGWLGEAPNDPGFVDLAQTLGYPMDDVDFSTLRPVVEDAITRGQWLVLAGHDIGEVPGRQVTRVSLLRELLAYAREPSRGVWIDTVAHIAEHVRRAGG